MSTDTIMSQNSEGDFSDEEDEISALEYARLNGLARNYLEDDTSLDHLISMQNVIIDNYLIDRDDSRLPRFEMPRLEDERMPVSQGAARLLASVAQTESAETIDKLIFPLLGSKDIKNARVELPLLRSNHESDCRKFATREGFETGLKDIKFPREILNIENNEGLQFPEAFYSFESETMDMLKHEKIVVTKDSMLFLQGELMDTLTHAEQERIWNSIRTHPKKPLSSRHVTPPLSPMLLPTPVNFEIPDSVCHVPLLSDPDSLIGVDLERIEDKIFKEDVPTPVRNKVYSTEGSASQYVNPADLYSSPEGMDKYETPSPEKKKHVTIAGMKVEELLTPPMPNDESKTVRFSNVVEELLYSRPESALSAALSEPVTDTKIIEEAFGKSGEEAMRRVEQERLVQTDYRVKVPTMDFSLPEPPWSNPQTREENAALLSIQAILKQVDLNRSAWPGVKKLLTKLRWLPFPHKLAKVALEESLDDDTTWKAYVRGPNDDDIVKSSDLTWKMEGLKILRDDDEDDEDIELGYFRTVVQDITSLVRKRKLEMDGHEQSRKQRQTTNHPTSQAEGSINPGDSMLGESARQGLDKFLEMRGVIVPGKEEDLRVESNSVVQDKANSSKARKHLNIPSNTKDGRDDNQIIPTKDKNAETRIEGPTVTALPAPTILPPPNTPIYILISTTLLKNRPLIRQLTTLLPTLKLTERDFSAHNTISWLPNSITRSPTTSPLSWEADILVSPCTGIILTTLQKIKQKPLPGRKTPVAIRERTEKVAGRYENLIVLVSSEQLTLDANDCLAWADFVSWTLSLEDSVTVQLVLGQGGGEGGELAKWIAGIVVGYKSMACVGVLENETYWEVFLRRAGMNAYAAQAVLEKLKGPSELTPEEIEKNGLLGEFGLAAFVKMSQEERVKKFAGLCGRRVIEKVGLAIDHKWE